MLIKQWRMPQRAVFVLDARRRLVHVEYVDDQMKEPDYGCGERCTLTGHLTGCYLLDRAAQGAGGGR